MKKFFKQYQEQIILAAISLIAFIIGWLAVGIVKAIMVIGIADIIYVFSILSDKKKKSPTNNIERIDKPMKKKTGKKKKKIWKILAITFLVLCICFLLAICGFMFYIVKEAPKFDPDKLYTQDASVVYDINNKVYAKLGAEQREKITYDEMSEVLIDAIIATEDSRFFEHNGFDLPRFAVATFKQIFTHGGGGASTLTMQVSKNTYTSTEASGIEGIIRKFTDIYLSIFQIEKNYSKQEIMEFYVNAPYLGSGAFGVEQACQNYFGKSAKDINLAEAALIAGLFQAPDAYDPFAHPKLAEERRETVLYLMKRHNYISQEEYEAAMNLTVDKLLVSKEKETGTDDYQAFIDTVVEEIMEDTKSSTNPNGLNPYLVPMEIYTTLDPDKQNHINKIINGETFTWENDEVDAGISVIDVKTGAIVAVGAGRHRTGKLQYNNATMLDKQIGSTSKPLYDYAPGIEYENWSTYTPFVDEEYTYSNGGNINNWDRKYNGFLTMRTALAQSRNVPALKAFKGNKNSNIKNFVLSLGLDPEIEDGIVHEAHAIGGYTGESPLSMSAAYAAFGNGGYYITPHSYTKFILLDSNTTQEKQIKKTRVMSEETAYMMTSLLQSSAQTGLGNQYNIGGATYGAKTGTSNYPEATVKYWKFGSDAVNDLWVDGVSPDYAISVWYGYTEITGHYTSTSYTISHRKLFQAVAKGIFKNGSNWTKPNGVVEVEIENESYPAKLPSEYTPDNMKITELFKAGTEPTEVSDRYSKLDSVKNLKGNISGNKLTLTWDAIHPNAIDDTAINSYLDSLYTSASFKAQAKEARLNYNRSFFGNLTYRVYSKDDSGTLTLLGTTDKPTYDITVGSNSATKYCVIASYSIFTANASEPTEVNVSLKDVKDPVEIMLNGDANINLNLNSTYEEKGVKVVSKGNDVTDKATVKIVIKDNQNTVVTSIDTTVANTYTISYTVKYESTEKTVTRVVNIK